MLKGVYLFITNNQITQYSLSLGQRTCARTLTRSLIYDLQLGLDLNLFLCCYTYIELHLDFVSNNDLDPDPSFDFYNGITVFKHDFNYELDLDFDVDHDLDIDLDLVHDYDLQPIVDLD